MVSARRALVLVADFKSAVLGELAALCLEDARNASLPAFVRFPVPVLLFCFGVLFEAADDACHDGNKFAGFLMQWSR